MIDSGMESAANHYEIGPAKCDNDIKDQPWFWGKIDKEEAALVVMEREHGHFLVRESAKPGEFTLVVRKKSRVRNIRIHRCSEGGYDLVEGRCGFPDVVSLIDHYLDNPDQLHAAFPSIDLIEPVCRPEESGEEMTYALLTDLVESTQDLLSQQQTCQSHVRKQKRIEREIEERKSRKESLNVVISLFEEQLELQNTELSSCLMKPATQETEEERSLKLNRATVQGRIQTLRLREREERKNIKRLQQERLMEMEEVDVYRPVLFQLQQEITLLRLRVEERGVDRTYLELLLKEQIYTDLSHYKESNWEVECDKEGAEQLLADTVPGTFLVRPSRAGGRALSIVCDNGDNNAVTKHCKIYYNDETYRYGFHPEYCVFSSVQELVIKHQTITLKFYNPALDVCLTYPVNFRQRNSGEHAPDDSVERLKSL